MAKKAIRPIRIEGNVAYVPLTRGYEAMIDAYDVPLVEGFNWYALVNAWAVRAMRNIWRDGIRETIYLHRVIMSAPQGAMVDHIDGNPLNNRKSNLRLATNAENQRNSKRRKDNTSGFKGVHLDKRKGLWRAQIKLNGTKRWLGYFGTPEEAHFAYCKASATIHGDFGRTE